MTQAWVPPPHEWAEGPRGRCRLAAKQETGLGKHQPPADPATRRSAGPSVRRCAEVSSPVDSERTLARSPRTIVRRACWIVRDACSPVPSPGAFVPLPPTFTPGRCRKTAAPGAMTPGRFSLPHRHFPADRLPVTDIPDLGAPVVQPGSFPPVRGGIVRCH